MASRALTARCGTAGRRAAGSGSCPARTSKACSPGPVAAAGLHAGAGLYSGAGGHQDLGDARRDPARAVDPDDGGAAPGQDGRAAVGILPGDGSGGQLGQQPRAPVGRQPAQHRGRVVDQQAGGGQQGQQPLGQRAGNAQLRRDGDELTAVAAAVEQAD